MRVRTQRGQAALALIAITVLVAGCSGSGSKPVAQIRTLNATTNGGFVTVLVNASATFGQQTLTQSAPSYLFINPGSSQFSYTTSSNIGQTISNLPPSTNAYITTANINSGINYTVYAIGRPDLVTPIVTSIPYGAMQDVIYPDTHTTPAVGSANIRFLDAAPDANGTNGVDIKIDGATAVTNLKFGSISTFQVTTAASHTITVVQTATSNNVLAPVNLTLGSQKSDTIILQEPTATPTPSPSIFTYQLQQVEDK